MVCTCALLLHFSIQGREGGGRGGGDAGLGHTRNKQAALVSMVLPSSKVSVVEPMTTRHSILVSVTLRSGLAVLQTGA